MSSAVPHAADSNAAALKQLRIHTGVVRRLAKEVLMYQTEAAELAVNLEKMKAAVDADEYRVRKQAEVLRESQMMVPDTERRLQTARDKMGELLLQHRDACSEDPIFQQATAVMQQQQHQPQEEAGDGLGN